MIRLYIDFDGVVMDSIPLLYGAYEESGGDMANEGGKREFFSKYDYTNVIDDKYLLNGSIECIKKLIDSKKFEISFLSHINSLKEGVIKVNYLRRHFNDDISIILVPVEVSKTKVVHSEGAILVDDFSTNLREWKSQGGLGIKFSNEKEESDEFIVINKLDQLIDLVDRIDVKSLLKVKSGEVC